MRCEKFHVFSAVFRCYVAFSSARLRSELLRTTITGIIAILSYCFFTFWATVCKTVRLMLWDRCLSCLSACLSVTLVYCGQTAGWIKMPLGTEIGLGSGDIVLHGDPAPHNKGQAPLLFGPCLFWQTAGWTKMPLGA